MFGGDKFVRGETDDAVVGSGTVSVGHDDQFVAICQQASEMDERVSIGPTPTQRFGAIGGTSFMWVQPLAMILGIIMLSAIAYVTLSTGERPFQSIYKHVSSILGWGWLGATMLANMVW